MGLNGHTSTPAKPYEAFDGQILMLIMPYKTFKLRLVHQRLDDGTPIELWDESKHSFFITVGSTVSCELLVDETDLSEMARGFWYFWQHQTGDILKDYELFLRYVAVESLTELYEAFNSTRTVVPKADEALHKGRPDQKTDPLASSAGGKSGKGT